MGRDAVGDDAGLRAKSVALRRNDVYVCVCIYIYMYLHMYIYIHVCIYTDT